MKFSKSVDMGLRILVLLAEYNGAAGKRLTAPQIGKELGLSYNNVVRIITRLRTAGMIETVSGKHGGVSLSRDAQGLSLHEIVVAMDGPVQLAPCELNPGGCPENRSCSVQAELFALSGQVRALLERVSIAGIVERRISRQRELQDRRLPIPACLRPELNRDPPVPEREKSL